MSAIPVQLERRFEQKWAARFGLLPAAVDASRTVAAKDTPVTPTGRRGGRHGASQKRTRPTAPLGETE
jgi:hypothetical protein